MTGVQTCALPILGPTMSIIGFFGNLGLSTTDKLTEDYGRNADMRRLMAGTDFGVLSASPNILRLCKFVGIGHRFRGQHGDY